MFGWLKNLFTRKSGDFTPRDRLIFEYFDGVKTVKADPMLIYRRIVAKGANLTIPLKVAFSASKDAPKAYDEVIQHVREIFSLKAPDGLDVSDTLAESEVVRLFDRFWSWVDDIKKNTSPIPTSVGGTSAPSGPTSEGPSPILNTSVSGSTASGPNTEPPTQSPPGSGLPTGSVTPPTLTGTP